MKTGSVVSAVMSFRAQQCKERVAPGFLFGMSAMSVMSAARGGLLEGG